MALVDDRRIREPVAKYGIAPVKGRPNESLNVLRPVGKKEEEFALPRHSLSVKEDRSDLFADPARPGFTGFDDRPSFCPKPRGKRSRKGALPRALRALERHEHAVRIPASLDRIQRSTP